MFVQEGTMKKTFIVLMLLALACCAGVAGEQRGKKITFLEIGSVNCIPCKMMQPVIKAIEDEYRGRVTVVFYDVMTPEGRSRAMSYGVRAIPTQVFLDANGKEFFRHVGYFPKEEIVKVLKTQGVE